MRKLRLIAGCINRRPDDAEWRNVHLDASPRNIFDAELDLPVAPEIVANIADELPMFRDGMFHEIVCDHVLEHLTYEQTAIALLALKRVLHPDGVIVIETPNMTEIAKAWLNGSASQGDLQQWIYGEDIGGAYDGHRYAYSPESLRKQIEKAGLKIVEQSGEGLAIRYVAKSFL